MTDTLTPGAAALRAIPTAKTDPDRIAVVSESGESTTYAELAERASRLAGALRQHGLRVGDVVAVLVENHPSYFEMIWACRLAGLYYVTLNTHLVAGEVAYVVNDSGARAVLASRRVPVAADLTAELAPDVQLWIIRHGSLPGWEDYDAFLADAPHYEADTALEGGLLQYSSGTTGKPKGIKRPLLPAPATAAEDGFTMLPALIGATGDSTYLCPAPMYHTAPQVWTMALLRMGATIVLMERFDAARTLELVERHRVTHGQFVPTMFNRMLKLSDQDRLRHDISSLQGVVHAAAPCSIDTKRRMIDWWGPIVHEYWSSSEGAGFTYINSADWLAHPGSVGLPLLGPLHVCDSRGVELPAGEVGVIWAEGTDFSYLNDPGKDAETTHENGWRSVGDMGCLDEDGYLYLTDRASFMVISGGVNIYPQEAEDALICHPKVLDVAVIGLPDDDLGEIVVAVVQPVDPAVSSPEFAAELTAWCEARLARYKCPRRVLFAETLPRSDTGKLYKRQLRDSLVAQHEAEATT